MKKELTPQGYLNRVLSTETSDNCPMRRALSLLGGKWRTHVIYELCRRSSCRFGELKRAIPRITKTMLTATLRELEEAGIVSRKQYDEIPPRVEYSLTEAGRALLPVFAELAAWGEEYLTTETVTPPE